MEEKAPLIKQSTLCKYRNNLNLHQFPVYGDYLVTEITKESADAFAARLCATGGKNGKRLSGNTVKSIISVLKAVIEYAHNRRQAQVANLSGITIKNPGKPIRVFSRNEQKRLEDYLWENIDPDNGLIGIMLCLYTGIRLGELCALRWEDVLLDEKELYIHATMLRIQTPGNPNRRTKVVVTKPKSNCSRRRIPLPPNLYGLLSEMRGPGNTYFLTGQEDFFIEPRIMEKHFKSAICTVGNADANFHTLRHGRTVYIKNKVDLRFQPRIPGDSQQYKDIYGERTACECLNDRVLNDYCPQNLKIRGRDHFSFWGMLIGICIHLDARYKAAYLHVT